MTTELSLSAEEARVLGVLIEKSMTTPDQYPLSLNALVNGCNQKSNRDPGLSLGSDDVKKAMRALRVKQLAVEIWPSTGSRIEKYRHLAESGLGLEEKQVAVLGELLLRRAQQPGELRTRASRMAKIESQGELKAAARRADRERPRRSTRPVPRQPRREIRPRALRRRGRERRRGPQRLSPASRASPRSPPARGCSLRLRRRARRSRALLARLEALEARVAELERASDAS